ncbi:MAG: TIGR03067 domain-containing protein [Gemmataceae bacterium]|nr:TIGR03067 domain-containing protein [Gemmataceae bacterium]
MMIDPLSRTVMRLGPDVADASAGELASCSAKSRDEQAFAALVRRFGPMVLGVCRRKIGLSLAVVVGIGTIGFLQTAVSGTDPQPAKKEASTEPPPAKETPRTPAKADAERLRGTWMIESARRNGVASKEGVASWNDEEMSFDGESVKFSRFPGRKKLYKLDPGWDEKRIDFEFREVLDVNQRITVNVPAIYRFEGDKLHIVFGVVNFDERPESFEWLEKGAPFTHILLKRAIPGEAKDLIAEERRALEGTWVSVAIEVNGERREMPDTKLILKGNRFTIRPKTQGLATAGEFTLDLQPSPRHINLTLLSSPTPESKGNTIHGIYSLNRRILTLCLDEQNKGRPANLNEANRVAMLFVPEGTDVKLPSTLLPAIGPNRLRELQTERIKALRTICDANAEQLVVGKGSVLEAIRADEELAAAEQELAKTQAERIQVLADLAQRLKKHEMSAVVRLANGATNNAEETRVRVARLKAEIELEKLKAAK